MRLDHGIGVGTGGALFCALVAVDHIVAGDFLLAGTHQGQFDLVLDFFDVDGATRWHATLERGGDLLGQARDGVVDARRGGGGATFNCEERLGDGHGDLVVGVGDDSAVTLDHAQLAWGGGCQILVGIGGLRRQRLRVLASCVGLHGWVSPLFLLFRRLLGAHRSVHLLDWPGRGCVMRAHPPARAYRLRDRLRNKGNNLPLPGRSQRFWAYAQKLLLMSAWQCLQHSYPNNAQEGLPRSPPQERFGC